MKWMYISRINKNRKYKPYLILSQSNNITIFETHHSFDISTFKYLEFPCFSANFEQFVNRFDETLVVIVTHPLDVLIVNSYAILQFIHKLSVFFSIVDGSKLVTKMRVQLYKIIGDGTSFTSCQNLRRRKEVSLLNNFWLISIHLKVGPRSPSLDSISAKRCSTWELDTVGSVPIAIK